MISISMNKYVYHVHPIYDLYASDEDGNIMNIIKKLPFKGHKQHNGYLQCMIRKYGGKYKAYYVHRFVWGCFNGDIPEGKVIDHINKDKKDNRLCNLQLITQQENCKKSAEKRHYTFTSKNHENKKCVKATNIENNEVLYFNSMYVIQQHLKINAGIVKMVCENINNCKLGLSKKDGNLYKFEYIKQDELPDKFIKSLNKKPSYKRHKPVLSDEVKKKHQLEAIKKWQKYEYKCLRCNKTLKKWF